MPSSPYIEVSLETRARIGEIRRRASAAEGRQVHNDEIVRRLIDAAERGRLARVAYADIRHRYHAAMKDLDGAMPIDHFVAQQNYAAGLKEALDLMEGKIAAEGKITGAAELFEHPKGMQFTVSIGIPEIRIAGAADPEREARRAMIEWLEEQG